MKKAEALLWANALARSYDRLNESAHASLRQSLLKALANHCAPAIYERFAEARKAKASPADSANDAAPRQDAGTSVYDRFAAEMRGGGFRRLFEDKPVLLRTIATIARQWIDTSREFITRLDADWAAIEHDLLSGAATRKVDKIEGDLSDFHNDGRSVQIVRFDDGSRVVYKPKDLRLDAAWYELVARLNRSGAPMELKATRAIVREGYGWVEFIDHTGCADQKAVKRFFRRAGAWLALFHCFAAADMHEENLIACGDHPTPIDIELILQALPEERRSGDPEAEAFEASTKLVANSIMMVGLLPAFGRSPNNDVFAVGGMNNWQSRKESFTWVDPNTDAMRPTRSTERATALRTFHISTMTMPNSAIISTISSRASRSMRDLSCRRPRTMGRDFYSTDFAGLRVRKVIHPTRFYALLAQRLKNHRTMDDGVIWSAQADFLARLTDWEKAFDPLWPLQRCERSALLALNVPYFAAPSDGKEIRDAGGVSIPTQVISGLDHARARVESAQ